MATQNVISMEPESGLQL